MSQDQPTNDDQRYILGLRKGDTTIIKEIYQSFYPKIEAYVLQNKGNSKDAEDLFAVALETLFIQARKGLEIRTSFGAYLYQICKNKWLNILNRDSRTLLNLENQPEQVEENRILEHFMEAEKVLLYHKHFTQLPNTCQKILKLSSENKKSQEIADLLEKNASYIRRRKGECIKELIKGIQDDPLFDQLK